MGTETPQLKDIDNCFEAISTCINEFLQRSLIGVLFSAKVRNCSFLRHVQAVCEAHPASCIMGFPRSRVAGA
jgi:hypothetical protein